MGLEIETIKHLIDEKTLKVLQILINNEASDFYLRELAAKASVSPATTYRIINRLLDLKLIEMTQVKKLKIYRISNNSQAQFLINLLKEEIDIKGLIKERVKEIRGLHLAVMHGKMTKNKANLLLIGANILKNEVNDLMEQLGREYDFKLSALTLTMEQYEQMTSMGLYSGEKEIIYSKQM